MPKARVRKWTPDVNQDQDQIPSLSKMSNQNLAPDPNQFQKQDPSRSLDQDLLLDHILDLGRDLVPDPKLAATHI